MKTKNYAILILLILGSKLLLAGNGFKFNSGPFTNFTINQAYLTANPGAWDSIIVEGNGAPNTRTITIDLAGGTLPMTFKTGYLLARKGGRFIIKNCTIQSDHVRKLWKGIFLENRHNANQNTSIEMENVQLNYAYDAVFTSQDDIFYQPTGPLDPKALAGALIKVQKCKFYNCRTSITCGFFDGYNSSRIEKCEFAWDKYFDTAYYGYRDKYDILTGLTADSQSFRTHVFIVGNQGIKLIGNKFTCFRHWKEWGYDLDNLTNLYTTKVSHSQRKGIGVTLVNSGTYIGASGPCFSYPDRGSYCHTCNGNDNSFEGFCIGIMTGNTKENLQHLGTDILNTKFKNCTYGVCAGWNPGYYIDPDFNKKQVWNVHIEHCNFETNNGYYYHELIYTKNAVDVFLQKCADFRIMNNRFSKNYGDPDEFNHTVEACGSIFGQEYSGNIYILNCENAVGQHPTISPSNCIYKNYFQNNPFVRCTDKFASITLDGNVNLPDNYSQAGAQIDCNTFNNTHPAFCTGGTHDILFRNDDQNTVTFTNPTIGRNGKPTHNKYSISKTCNGVYRQDTFDISFFEPSSISDPPYSNNTGIIYFYYQNNNSILPTNRQPTCLFNFTGKGQTVGTTFGNSNDKVGYPEAYANYCPKIDRPGETMPISYNNSGGNSNSNQNNYNFPDDIIYYTEIGISLNPNPWSISSNTPLILNYPWPEDVDYLELYIYSTSGELVGYYLIPKSLFGPGNDFDIANWIKTHIGPGTYYFTFRNNKGEYETKTIVVLP